MMDLLTKKGQSKLVSRCTYPLTGIACVSRIYSDVAIFDLTPQGPRVVEMVEGMTIEELQRMTGIPLLAPQTNITVAAASGS